MNKIFSPELNHRRSHARAQDNPRRRVRNCPAARAAVRSTLLTKPDRAELCLMPAQQPFRNPLVLPRSDIPLVVDNESVRSVEIRRPVLLWSHVCYPPCSESDAISPCPRCRRPAAYSPCETRLPTVTCKGSTATSGSGLGFVGLQTDPTATPLLRPGVVLAWCWRAGIRAIAQSVGPQGRKCLPTV
jgi:hypothetical protein